MYQEKTQKERERSLFTYSNPKVEFRIDTKMTKDGFYRLSMIIFNDNEPVVRMRGFKVDPDFMNIVPPINQTKYGAFPVAIIDPAFQQAFSKWLKENRQLLEGIK